MTATPMVPPQPAPGLACHDLAVARGDAAILRDLDLHVEAGTLTVVVGPSGAGKTSLLRAIAGLDPVVAGSIRLAGSEITQVPTHRRRLGYVFQEPRLLPHLTVADNVAFPLRMTGHPRSRRRAAAAALLDEVALPGMSDRRPGSLSGGEQQRVALARALIASPQLLLLDEPLSAVDPNRREDLRALIMRIQRDRAITTVYVTHDRTEAAELGDHVAVLIEGRIVDHAPPERLFTRPSSAVAARFLGAANILAGRVRSGTFHAGGLQLAVDAEDGPATVTIRPERVRLRPGGSLRGRVVDASFQGSHRRVVLEIDGTQLVAHVDPDESPPPGTEVAVTIASEHVWLLPDPGASSANAPTSATR